MIRKKPADSILLIMIKYMLIVGAFFILAIFACGGGFKNDSSDASILSEPVFGHPQDSFAPGP